jgi:DNA-binding MarR family transcriptional regulator
MEALADLAPTLKEAELRVLLELTRRQLRGPRAIRASSRELASACKMGRSNVQTALDNLPRRGLITTRQGTATTAAV